MSRVRPILFNTDMVRAILDDRKTVTRRAIKFPTNKYTEQIPKSANVSVCKRTLHSDKVCFLEKPFYTFNIKPPCWPEDILYVRETWFYEMHLHDKVPGEPDLPSGRYSHRYVYKADSPDYPVGIGVGVNGWRPSIHMPKEAARIWLKVTDVRVERLQEITEEGIWEEGFQFVPPCLHQVTEESYCDLDGPCTSNIKYCSMSIGDLFGTILWNSTIKKSDLDRYGWEANPWVWVIEYERCDRPEGWPG